MELFHLWRRRSIPTSRLRDFFRVSARVSRVGFGGSPKRSFKVRETETVSPARETRARYPAACAPQIRKSVFANEQVVREFSQRLSFFAKNVERVLRSVGQPPRFAARCLQPDYRGIGRLLRRDIFSCAFTEFLARLRDIEDVVDHLESQAKRVAELCNRAQFFRVGICAHRTKTDGSCDHGRGFIFVDVAKFMS